jgi:hypothetical protein
VYLEARRTSKAVEGQVDDGSGHTRAARGGYRQGGVDLLPRCFHAQFRDKNRRDIGKSQSKWAAFTMETPGSPRPRTTPGRSRRRRRRRRRRYRRPSEGSQPRTRDIVKRQHDCTATALSLPLPALAARARVRCGGGGQAAALTHPELSRGLHRGARLREAVQQVHEPGRAFPSSISNDKNRRDIGKSQSKWTAFKIETPRSRDGERAGDMATAHARPRLGRGAVEAAGGARVHQL